MDGREKQGRKRSSWGLDAIQDLRLESSNLQTHSLGVSRECDCGWNGE